MILIVSHKEDYTTDYVVNKLNKAHIPYKRLNCEDIDLNTYNIRLDKQLHYSILGQVRFTSVWFRRTKLPSVKNLSYHDTLYILSEYESFIKNLFSVIEAKWVSDPFYVYSAENKLLQLKTALKLGFEIPETIISNCREEIRKFYLHCRKKIIIKPLGQTRVTEPQTASFIFTNSVSDDVINRLNDFDITPAIIQEQIAKAYEIRVTVVGSQVFSAAVDSQADSETLIDWRKKRIPFKAIEIPDRIAHLCVKLVNELNLEFGAIDLIMTPDNRYVFLEINPNGQWAWIEQETGLPISEAIIDSLLTIDGGKNETIQARTLHEG